VGTVKTTLTYLYPNLYARLVELVITINNFQPISDFICTETNGTPINTKHHVL